jgi:hypothetical protein
MSPPDEYTDEDANLPLEQDLCGDGDDLPEMICPNCRGVVTEDTQKCPHCGDWIVAQSPSQGGWRRWLFVAVVLMMLYAVLRWTF